VGLTRWAVGTCCGCPPPPCTIQVCCTGCGGLPLPGVAISIPQGAMPPATGTTGAGGCVSIPYVPSSGQTTIFINASKAKFASIATGGFAFDCTGATPTVVNMTPDASDACACCATVDPSSVSASLTDINGTFSMTWDGTLYRLAYTATHANCCNCLGASGAFALCIEYTLTCAGVLTQTWFEDSTCGPVKYNNAAISGGLCDDLLGCSFGATGTAVATGPAITGNASCPAFTWTGTIPAIATTGALGVTPFPGPVAITGT
jgi:hypothetical protein